METAAPPDARLARTAVDIYQYYGSEQGVVIVDSVATSRMYKLMTERDIRDTAVVLPLYLTETRINYVMSSPGGQSRFQRAFREKETKVI